MSPFTFAIQAYSEISSGKDKVPEPQRFWKLRQSVFGNSPENKNHSLIVFQLSESDKAPVVTDSTKTVIAPSAVDEQQTVESASVDSSIKSSQVIYT